MTNFIAVSLFSLLSLPLLLTSEARSEFDPLMDYVRDRESGLSHEEIVAKNGNPFEGAGFSELGDPTNVWTLTVDTRDQETCHKVAESLHRVQKISPNDYRHFCDVDVEKPLISISGVREKGLSFSFSDLPERSQNLGVKSVAMGVPAVGMVALLFALPESFTGWEPFDAGVLKDKYVENVTTKPEIEDNHWTVNWIGHPYFGAIYYRTARHAGFNRGESFLYSVFMSTFFWEYGIEAVSEVPSVQDLIITPIVGSLVGEAFIQAEKNIIANDGKLLGSQGLGNVAIAVMDPAEALLNGINETLGIDVIKEADAYVRPCHRRYGADRNGVRGGGQFCYDFGIEFKF